MMSVICVATERVSRTKHIIYFMYESVPELRIVDSSIDTHQKKITDSVWKVDAAM